MAFSLLLMSALSALASFLTAAERTAADFVQTGRMPNWSGQQHPVRRWARELWRHCTELTQLSEPYGLQKRLSCVICFVTAVLAFAVIPLAPPFGGASAAAMIAPGIDVAVLFVLAMFMLRLFGEVLASNEWEQEKLFAGGLVAFAACGVSVLGIARLSGTWRIDAIVNGQEQANIWWLAQQPLGFAAMLLYLVWLICGIAPPQPLESTVEAAATERDQRPAGGSLQIASNLQLIAAVYLLVVLFLGGWHFWGIDATPGGEGWDFLRWTAQFLALHLKVLAVLIWLVWLRFFRLQSVRTTAWRSRLATAAMIAAALNFIVTEFAERYLASQPLVWKAAIGWTVLTIGLAIIAAFSKQMMPD